jgi:hypothetical protein
VELCLQIEAQKPDGLGQLYALTLVATERFNDLQQEFDEQGSEIETAARECIAPTSRPLPRLTVLKMPTVKR